jgi:hypothetical protein
VLTQFKNAGLFPNTAAPVLTPSSGTIAGGQVAVSVTGSPTVLYTDDGSDPRLPGGAPNPAAHVLLAGSSIPVTHPLRVKLRARSAGGEWSALTESFFVPQGGSALPAGSVVVSELNYFPTDDGAEFVELLNVSPNAVNLRGASFTHGIEFAFSAWQDAVLEPGERLTVVDSDFAFRDRYGWDQPVAGIYRSNLANEGERLSLADSAGNSVFDFTWSDAWAQGANGEEQSLVLLPPREGMDLSDGASWTASLTAGGKPNESDWQSYAGANPDGDDDGDGTSNFTRYALAGDGELHLPRIAATAGGVQFTVYTNALAADAEVSMETSADLTNWLPLTDAVPVEQEITAGIRRAVWTLPGGEAKRFVRLKVGQR